MAKPKAKSSTTTTTRKTKWTDKRVESLVKYFNQYKDQKDWAKRVARRMRVFTPDAVYKKAGREGLIRPTWALVEKDKPVRRKKR